MTGTTVSDTYVGESIFMLSGWMVVMLLVKHKNCENVVFLISCSWAVK